MEDGNSDISSELRLPSLSEYKHVVVPLVGEKNAVFHAETCRKFHRRSANRSDFTRVTLGIDYSLEKKAAESFVCIDTKHSMASGGVCGKDIIDSLDDYDLRIRD